MRDDIEISVVIPTRNEESNVAAIAAAVIAQLDAAGATYELIFIDNVSSDATVPLVKAMCAANPRIKLIVNTRNFGQMRSPTHGIFQAQGRGVINMCADFQDDPALIGQFIARWRGGAPIVLGVRESEEGGSLPLRVARNAAYGIGSRLGDYKLIPNATGFGIYDRRVVDTIKALNEPEPFFRGLLVETGYPIATIGFPRKPRAGGRSNNNFWALLDFTISGLASWSKKLLRAPMFLAVFVGVGALLALLAAPVAALAGWPAWPWLVAALAEAQVAALLFFLGLVGDQLRHVSERTRGFPLVVEGERVNFDA
ncbi:glycosyltransferase family 2 protein [Sphingomonas immobilis]|uniref:Glycosyltransferase family 2 protein n=1 Tax=Sphingomonas immobilis TaxID=3063997 RepID=A0ABT9A4V0_9SPHN|nr:glycosyltransferase family 2 protein [Sphingomonas sp. CA1-15]MDO7843996.1 glycosyltransferase family 2 protein [Sphingomonas sp. CA1-15]